MITTEVTPNQCAATVMDVVPAAIRYLRSEMRQQSQSLLTLTQLRVLHFLQRYPRASLSEVADYLDVTRSTMSATIERLVQRGLVDRAEDPQERRRVILTLTATGVQQLQQVSDATHTKVADALAHLSEPQLRQIIQGLALLGDVFQDIDAVSLTGK